MGGASIRLRMAEDTDTSPRGFPLKNTPTLTIPHQEGEGNNGKYPHKTEENLILELSTVV